MSLLRIWEQLKRYMADFTVKGGRRNGLSSCICVCGTAVAGKKIYQASGTDLFYRWIWHLSGKNASLRDCLCFYEGRLSGH